MEEGPEPQRPPIGGVLQAVHYYRSIDPGGASIVHQLLAGNRLCPRGGPVVNEQHPVADSKNRTTNRHLQTSTSVVRRCAAPQPHVIIRCPISLFPDFCETDTQMRGYERPQQRATRLRAHHDSRQFVREQRSEGAPELTENGGFAPPRAVIRVVSRTLGPDRPIRAPVKCRDQLSPYVLHLRQSGSPSATAEQRSFTGRGS